MQRIYELGEAHKVSPYYGKYSHCNLYSSWTFVNMVAITPSKIVAIHLKAIKIETIYVNKKKSPARNRVGDVCVIKLTLCQLQRADALPYLLNGTIENAFLLCIERVNMTTNL